MKKLAILTISALVISVFLVASVAAPDCEVSLPPGPVTMVVHNGTISYFDTTLSDVPSGFDITNGVYLGWCIDTSVEIPRGTEFSVMLYSSCEPPVDLEGYEWDKVNYILNHKPPTALMTDIQDAIWAFVNLDGLLTPTTPEAQAMVDDAEANGAGFVPELGEVVAVICYPDDPAAQMTIIELRKLEYLKQFTDSGAFCGFTAPEISSDGRSSDVFELHSGPRIWWQVTYYFENSEAFLGDEYRGGHYFILWDKWGGNLMALDSPPVDFDEETNEVELDNDAVFSIDPRLGVTEDGYKGYIHPYLDISDLASHGSAIISVHIGDQQQGTNPGKGKGSHPHDGKSYDADIRWEIGWLDPGESATLVIYLAPGKNPGGKLQFSSTGCYCINTGPRVRVYGDLDYEDFLYAIDRTVQLCVQVEDAGASNDESMIEVSATPMVVANEPSVLIEGTVTDQSPAQAGIASVFTEDMSAWTEDSESQEQQPSDVTGVPVQLEAFGSGGSYINIDTHARAPQFTVTIAGVTTVYLIR